MVKKKGAGVLNSVLQDVKKNKSMIEPVYDTVSYIGLIYKFIRSVIFTIVCIILMIIGYYLIKNNDKSEKTPGTINVDNCSVHETKNKRGRVQTSNICDVTIDYKVDDVEYSKKHRFNKLMNDNDVIDVFYNPSDPNQFSVIGYFNYIGIGMIVVGILVFIYTWVTFVITLLFKPLQAAEGTGVIVGEGLDNVVGVFDDNEEY
jgi:hypothetical protein